MESANLVNQTIQWSENTKAANEQNQTETIKNTQAAKKKKRKEKPTKKQQQYPSTEMSTL